MDLTTHRPARSIEEIVNLVVLGVVVLVTIAIFRQTPFEWRHALAASGVLLFHGAWTVIYARLKRERPDHPLARASWLGFRFTYRGRREQRRLPWRIMLFHYERHRLDLWLKLLIAGALMVIGSIPFGDWIHNPFQR